MLSERYGIPDASGFTLFLTTIKAVKASSNIRQKGFGLLVYQCPSCGSEVYFVGSEGKFITRLGDSL